MSSITVSSYHTYDPDRQRGFDKAGYIPVVSTFSGLARVITGIFILSTTYLSPEDQQNQESPIQATFCKQSISYGKQMIARGLIEMLPVIGNIIMGIHDFNWYSARLTVSKTEQYMDDFSDIRLQYSPIISFKKV